MVTTSPKPCAHAALPYVKEQKERDRQIDREKERETDRQRQDR